MKRFNLRFIFDSTIIFVMIIFVLFMSSCSNDITKDQTVGTIVSLLFIGVIILMAMYMASRLGADPRGIELVAERPVHDRRIALKEWKYIKHKMTFNKRLSGYVDFDTNNKFEFYDSDPKIDGISAMEVTIEEVKEYINNFGM